MLEERYEYEPVVDEEVGDSVVFDEGGDSLIISESRKSCEDNGESGIGEEDLVAVSSVEEERSRVVVISPRRVMSLSRSIHNQVGGPSEELLNDEIVESVDGSVFEKLLQIVSVDLDGLSLGFGSNFLGRSRGNEDFFSSHVSGRGVVLGVGDSPRVVRNEDEGVKNESNGVVERFRSRECLVTAFVGDNPDPGEVETGQSPIRRPEGPFRDGTEGAVDDLAVGAEVAVDEGRGVHGRS